MDSKWFALGIVPAASAAVLFFGFAASSIATAEQPSSPVASEALSNSESSGFCQVELAEAPAEVETCAATVAPPADREVQECPVTGARGKSTLHLEEVLGRVHNGVGACPHEAAAKRASSKKKQGTWL